MTEAIRTGSFMNGFTRGMDTIDRHVDRNQRRELQREAINMQNEDRAYNRERQGAADARAQEAIDLQRERLEFNQNRLASADRMAEEKHAWELKNQKKAQRDAELKNLSEEAGQYFHLAAQGSWDALDPQQLIAFHDKAVAARRPTLSPLSWDPETIARVKKLGPLLQQVQAGNFEHINAPGNLKILSGLPGWSEKLNQGVGEQGRNGSTIVSKELAELKMGPEGRVVPMLKVNTEDGESYIAEMSAFRSSDPNEPVIAADSGDLIENALGQFMLANLFSDPKAQATLSTVRGQLFGTKKTNDMSSTGKTIRDLMKYGVSQEKSIELATQSKQDPQAAALSLAKAILSNDMYEGTPEDAMREARQALGVAVQSEVGSGGEDPKLEAMFKKLRANPNNKDYTDEQLREALRQKFQA